MLLYFSQVTNMFGYVLGRVFSAIRINLGCIYFFEVCQVTGHWNWYCWVLWYITWLALGINSVLGFVALLVASSVVTLVVCVEHWGVWLKSAVRHWQHIYLYNLILIVLLLCSFSWFSDLSAFLILYCHVVLLFLCDRFFSATLCLWLISINSK